MNSNVSNFYCRHSNRGKGYSFKKIVTKLKKLCNRYQDLRKFFKTNPLLIFFHHKPAR